MKALNLTLTAAACVLLTAAVLPARDADSADNTQQQILPNPVITVSTVASNGDVNPYGVAFLPQG